MTTPPTLPEFPVGRDEPSAEGSASTHSGRSDHMLAGRDRPFTEWWSVASDKIARSVPVLREYRDGTGCSHFLANMPSEAATEETP